MVFEATFQKIRNRKIHILLDNAKIHHAKKVEKFLKRKRKFKLHFLPAYAPDLNAVELFNNALKSDIRHQKAMDSDELIDFVNQYMETKGNITADSLCWDIYVYV